MTITTKPATDDYRDGWDRIFGRKDANFGMVCITAGQRFFHGGEEYSDYESARLAALEWKQANTQTS